MGLYKCSVCFFVAFSAPIASNLRILEFYILRCMFSSGKVEVDGIGVPKN